MQDNEIITMTKKELITLLIESYTTGIKTVKEVVNTSVNPDPAELYKNFEARFNFYESKRNEQG